MVGRSSGRTWQTIHHGIVSTKDLNGITATRVILKTVLLLTPVSSLGSDTLQRHYPLPDESPYSQSPTIQQKIEELRLLAGKFSSPQDAHIILELVKFNLRQGDKRFLNERLEQLRMFDSRQVWNR